jgi:hypothetical protein
VVCGSSAGDDADTFPLGFGGRGASRYLAAAPGGGGWKDMQAYKSNDALYIKLFTLYPGAGRMCVEIFDADPSGWGYGG